jgi:chemotaxis receptor (MCP) glutamine deamidase CheD
MALEIQIIVWDRHKNVAGLNHILHSIKVSCFKVINIQYMYFKQKHVIIFY